MIKQFKIKIFIILVGALIYGQEESIYWEVADPIVNSEFIEAYIDQLIKADRFEENTIQASHSIIVQMVIMEEKVELKKLKAKNYQMGEYQSFLMHQIEKMDPVQLNIIISREYQWKDVTQRDLSELEDFSTVDNIFKERSFKDARDAFWWSNSQISASTAAKVFIRGKNSSLAFRLEQGFSELGLTRHLSENMILGLSNDIVSTYVIIPAGNTKTVVKGVGHPLEGNFGFGFKFDTHMLGGQVNYMDPDGGEYDHTKMFSRKHLVMPASSGLLYWSNTFQINRKVDSDYGTKIKNQKSSQVEAKKQVAKSRQWIVGDKEFLGRYQSADEEFVIILVDKDEEAHKAADKGRDWTTKEGRKVKAVLKKITKKKITLVRIKDDFEMAFNKNDLSTEDQNFLDRLQWDGSKTKKIAIGSLSSSDEKMIKMVTAVIKERKGKGRELRVSKPFASMRLKTGLTFTQFLHGVVDKETDVLTITDRVEGAKSVGLYLKVEGITDTKDSKAYLQINTSGSGFKSYGLGFEHNIWRMVNFGIDFTLYPNNSFITFQDSRTNSESEWDWYPGTRVDENGKGGGSFLISPYITVNF